MFAKAMALQLQHVLDTLLSNDQSSFVTGRATITKIRSAIDIVHYVNEQNLPGILTYIDFEKAFDTVNLEFLQKCLKAMNCREYVMNCMYYVHGYLFLCHQLWTYKPMFSPSRGIRQVCPISANIFIVIVEVVAHPIMTNSS